MGRVNEIMSVLKSQRKESQFEVIAHGYRMRRAITDLLLRDFGYKPQKPNEYETEYQIERRKAFEQWFIVRMRYYVLDTLRRMMREINIANKIFPTMMREFEERRIHQDLALTECFNLLQELQYAIETLPVDINKLLRFDEMIQRQITLIKAWRKADNRHKEKLKQGNV